MAHDVFICYSSKDKPTADAVCATLEQRGIRCWMAPRDVLPGTDWSESIIDAIAGARAIVLIYSQHANESPQVRREIERAVHKRVAIVPFRIEDVPMSKSLEYFISTPHWLDALTPPLQQHLAHLADTLTTLLSPPAKPRVEPVPAPMPVPPAPLPIKRSWTTLVAAAAVLLALTGIASYWFSQQSPVDPGLVGVWERKLLVNGLPIVEKSSIHVNGYRSVVSTFEDHGRFTAAAGRWTMVNTTGLRTQGTFEFTAPRTVTISGPFGSAPWSQRENSVVTPGQLLGVFDASGRAPGGLSTFMELHFAPDGTYTFTIKSNDGLDLTARGGKWNAVSQVTGLLVEGIYEILDADRFSLSSAAEGKVVFQRSSW